MSFAHSLNLNISLIWRKRRPITRKRLLPLRTAIRRNCLLCERMKRLDLSRRKPSGKQNRALVKHRLERMLLLLRVSTLIWLSPSLRPGSFVRRMSLSAKCLWTTSKRRSNKPTMLPRSDYKKVSTKLPRSLRRRESAQASWSRRSLPQE